ncbi:hypothetical protein AVEN_101930-1 [Araneus ventricosus]|uniref:Pre-C2HC domain-containing protein n=1 Tax=Araneus ventricosus TaxID=182803 RepID=A0A4Y2DAM6_ARAVE|nr:hypothetical protein AVEN_101930-1 [Araneus ventricosus]
MSKAPVPSFLEIVQRERSACRIRIIRPQNTSALVMRPKTASSHDKTKRKLVNEVTLRNLHVKIKKFKRISNGGIVVEVVSNSDIDQLIAQFAKLDSVNNSFIYSKPKKRRPQFIFFGINKDLTKKQLADSFVFKNDLLKSDNPENPKFKVNFSMKSKYGANWVIMLNPIFMQVFKKVRAFSLSGGSIVSMTSTR